jgi:Na+-translocating ferredoxin:NAD+ oxidoreductase RnfE subunit
VNDTERYSPFLPLLAGLVPFYIMVTNTSGGLMAAGGFLIAYTIAFIATSYLPSYFSKPVIFFASILFSTIGVSLFAALVRVMNPFLYERFFPVIYMACFSAPVYQIAGIAGAGFDRDRGLEQLAHGLGFSATIVAIGLIRELFTTGSVMIAQVPLDQSRTILAFFAQPSGAFILLALILATGRTAARILKRSTM